MSVPKPKSLLRIAWKITEGKEKLLARYFITKHKLTRQDFFFRQETGKWKQPEFYTIFGRVLNLWFGSKIHFVVWQRRPVYHTLTNTTGHLIRSQNDCIAFGVIICLCILRSESGLCFWKPGLENRKDCKIIIFTDTIKGESNNLQRKIHWCNNNVQSTVLIAEFHNHKAFIHVKLLITDPEVCCPLLFEGFFQLFNTILKWCQQTSFSVKTKLLRTGRAVAVK